MMQTCSAAGLVPTLDSVRASLVAFARAHPEIRRLVVFGSVARGEAHADSDVDVVADLVPGSLPQGMAGFSYLYDLECELAARLGRGAHLIEREVVNGARRIGNNALPRAVERDGKLVYELESAAA